MRKAALLLGVLPGLSAMAGCSPASDSGVGNGVGNGGDGANGGSGGIITGGTAGNSMGGTVITTGGTGAGGSGGGCNDLTVMTEPVTPTVLILVDNSSSMFEPRDQLWDPLYNALMAPGGIVQSLESKIRFGFANFQGAAQVASSESDPACATVTTVPYALDNYEAINTVYTQLGTQWMAGVKWETPTGHAVARVTPELAALAAEPAGPKYILLVTDGNPNTCRTLDPQCGQDLSVKAVQDAFVQGIGTLVLGIGDIVAANSGCNTVQSRCGTDHLQDIANAGTGQPVQAPPMDYVYQPCVANNGAMLTAAYSPSGGTSPYFTAGNPAELGPVLQGLLTGVLSCTLDMNAIVTGNPALGTVTVSPAGGTPREVAINETGDGWRLEPNNYQVTLLGQACADYQTVPDTRVDISFPCAVAEPR